MSLSVVCWLFQSWLSKDFSGTQSECQNSLGPDWHSVGKGYQQMTTRESVTPMDAPQINACLKRAASWYNMLWTKKKSLTKGNNFYIMQKQSYSSCTLHLPISRSIYQWSFKLIPLLVLVLYSGQNTSMKNNKGQ